jgi:hypothetical protein
MKSHDLAGIDTHMKIFIAKTATGKRKMPQSKKEIRSSKQPMLASQYRAIGPAAIAAALLHTTKTKKPAQKFILPRAA